MKILWTSEVNSLIVESINNVRFQSSVVDTMDNCWYAKFNSLSMNAEQLAFPAKQIRSQRFGPRSELVCQSIDCMDQGYYVCVCECLCHKKNRTSRRIPDRILSERRVLYFTTYVCTTCDSNVKSMATFHLSKISKNALYFVVVCVTRQPAAHTHAQQCVFEAACRFATRGFTLRLQTLRQTRHSTLKNVFR